MTASVVRIMADTMAAVEPSTEHSGPCPRVRPEATRFPNQGASAAGPWHGAARASRPKGEGTTAMAGKRILHINGMSYELAPEQDMGDALNAVNALTGAGSGAQRFKVLLDGITTELFVSPAHVLTAAAYDRGHQWRASSVQDSADR